MTPTYPYRLPASNIVHTADTDPLMQVADLRQNLRYLDNLKWRKGSGGNSRLFVGNGDDIDEIIKQYKLRLKIVQARTKAAGCV